MMIFLTTMFLVPLGLVALYLLCVRRIHRDWSDIVSAQARLPDVRPPLAEPHTKIVEE